MLVGSTGRVGAGGGSGAIVFSEAEISGDRTVAWTVGKGGQAGPDLWGEFNGAPGTATVVYPSFDQQLTAEGGLGGIYVATGLTPVKTEVSDWPAPSMGGNGGMPRGVSGSDGQLDVRFVIPLEVKGGPGGRLQVDAGAGGDGASINFVTPIPGTYLHGRPGVKVAGKFSGAAGEAGMVELQVGMALPEFLKIKDNIVVSFASTGLPPKEKVPAAGKQDPANASSLDFLLQELRRQSDALKGDCPKGTFEVLHKYDFSTMDYPTKAALLFSTEMSLAAFLRALISKAGVPTSIWSVLLASLIPSVANAPGIDYPLAPKLKDLTGVEVEEMAAAYDAAAKFIEDKMGKSDGSGKVDFPLTEATISTINNIRAYSLSFRQELVNRHNRQISDRQAPIDFFGGNVRSKESPPARTNGLGPGPAKAPGTSPNLPSRGAGMGGGDGGLRRDEPTVGGRDSGVPGGKGGSGDSEPDTGGGAQGSSGDSSAENMGGAGDGSGGGGDSSSGPRVDLTIHVYIQPN